MSEPLSWQKRMHPDGPRYNLWNVASALVLHLLMFDLEHQQRMEAMTAIYGKEPGWLSSLSRYWWFLYSAGPSLIAAMIAGIFNIIPPATSFLSFPLFIVLQVFTTYKRWNSYGAGVGLLLAGWYTERGYGQRVTFLVTFVTLFLSPFLSVSLFHAGDAWNCSFSKFIGSGAILFVFGFLADKFPIFFKPLFALFLTRYTMDQIRGSRIVWCVGFLSMDQDYFVEVVLRDIRESALHRRDSQPEFPPINAANSLGLNTIGELASRHLGCGAAVSNVGVVSHFVELLPAGEEIARLVTPFEKFVDELKRRRRGGGMVLRDEMEELEEMCKARKGEFVNRCNPHLKYYKVDPPYYAVHDSILHFDPASKQKQMLRQIFKKQPLDFSAQDLWDHGCRDLVHTKLILQGQFDRGESHETRFRMEIFQNPN